MIKHIKIPVYYEYIDKTSLTKNNDNEFFYTKLAPGIIINGLHAITIAKSAHVEESFIIDEYNNLMAQEYYFFLCIVQERLDLIDDIWIIIRDFYFNHYRTYIKIALPLLSIHFAKVTLPLIKSRAKNWTKSIPINILKFIEELETDEFTPIRYLT